jgi:hypothetical protein
MTGSTNTGKASADNNNIEMILGHSSLAIIFIIGFYAPQQ